MKKQILIKLVLLAFLGVIIFSCTTTSLKSSKYKPEESATAEDFK